MDQRPGDKKFSETDKLGTSRQGGGKRKVRLKSANIAQQNCRNFDTGEPKKKRAHDKGKGKEGARHSRGGKRKIPVWWQGWGTAEKERKAC